MAGKRTSRRNEDVADFAGPDANKEAIEKLANAAAAENKKRGTEGKNVGEASDETVGMHVNLIKAAEIEWRELRDKASQAQGVLRQRYKVAKGDGVDVDSLKLAFRFAERATGEVISEQRNVGRYLKIMGSPLGTQWSLFDEPDADGAKLDATAQAAARDALLGGLGVDPAYRRVFPDGDYRDPQVKAAAEKFAADHPRLLQARQTGPQVPADLASRLLAGRKPGSLIDPRAVQASLDAINQTR